MQGAILSADLPDWTEVRQAAAKAYDAELNQIENVVVPSVAPGRTHVYHLYTIEYPRRDALAAHLNAGGIQATINYPTALPFLTVYSRFNACPEQFPKRVWCAGQNPLAADVRRVHA